MLDRWRHSNLLAIDIGRQIFEEVLVVILRLVIEARL